MKNIKNVNTIKKETNVTNISEQNVNNVAVDTETLPVAPIAKKAEKLVEPIVQKEVVCVSESVSNANAVKGPTFVVEERQLVKPRKPRKKIEKMTDKVYVEFAGLQINIQEVVESAKEHYKALFEKENEAINSIAVYVKPEERVAYYAVNGIGSDDYKVGI